MSHEFLVHIPRESSNLEHEDPPPSVLRVLPCSPGFIGGPTIIIVFISGILKPTYLHPTL